MASFGDFCLLFALCLSGYALFASLVGARHQSHRIVRSAERAALAAAASVTLALLALVYLLLSDSFATAHVANNSSRDLPIFYKIAAIWGGHDGSMLLWVFFTALISAVAIWQNRHRHRALMPYVTAVLMLDLSFFLALNVFLSNPFTELAQVLPSGAIESFLPADGRGLNPLLQYWAMVIHPPILYVGFIGFLVPFAFAVGALAARERGTAWIGAMRRWTLLTWLFLGIGLVLGAKWAYVVLGWGGYWAWDPVENSSLMPWLVGTAFLHSIIVQERRGMLKTWNALLAALTYLLGVFGTFITRSGVVSSVHAFADSKLGKFFIIYMAAVLVGSLLLIAGRRTYLESERRLDSILSRESAFLFNNLVLVAACFAVLWGTMFPVLSQWIRDTQITVGPPFFNKIVIPIGLLLLFLTGIGPLFAWRRTSFRSIGKALLWPGIFAVAALVGLTAGGMRTVIPIVCLALCVFVVTAVVEEFWKGARVRSAGAGEGFVRALVRLVWKNQRRYGGYVVHLGVALTFIGLAGNAFNTEAAASLKIGEEMTIGDYRLKMSGYKQGRAQNYRYAQASIEAYRHGKLIGALRPEQRVFSNSNQAMTTVALHSTPEEDLYVVFAGANEAGPVCDIKAYVNPLVFWIWLGAAVMTIGTIMALAAPSGRTPAIERVAGGE